MVAVGKGVCVIVAAGRVGVSEGRVTATSVVEVALGIGVAMIAAGGWVAGTSTVGMGAVGVGAGAVVQAANKTAKVNNQNASAGFIFMAWRWDELSLFVWESAYDTRVESGWGCAWAV